MAGVSAFPMIESGSYLHLAQAIQGTSGDDSIEGTSNADKIHGLGGDDTIDGVGGDDLIKGGAGADHLAGGEGADRVLGGSGDDLLSGGDGDDYLVGGAGDNWMIGGLGSDGFVGGKGADTFDGGDGFDFVDLTHAKTNLVADLAAGTISGQGGDTLVSIEEVVTGRGDDLIIAGDGGGVFSGFYGNDTLHGGAGDELLFGSAGRDEIFGSAGQDTLAGGGSKDVFVFTQLSDSTSEAPDLINDLSDKDTIDLSAIDADVTQAGDQAFVLVSQLDGHAGEIALSYVAQTGMPGLTVFVADVDGDGVADMTITMQGDVSRFTNFVL